jgi:hypothetical protein
MLTTPEAFLYEDVWFVDEDAGLILTATNAWPYDAGDGPTPPTPSGNRMGGTGAIRKSPVNRGAARI